jgi:hypothetical protein
MRSAVVVTLISEPIPPFPRDPFWLNWLGFPVAVAIGVTVFKYRLFDIDRLISRTVSCAFVATLLVFGFFTASAMLGSRVSERPLFVAAATLVAAGLFNPLRSLGQPLGESPIQQVCVRRGDGDVRVRRVTAPGP